MGSGIQYYSRGKKYILSLQVTNRAINTPGHYQTLLLSRVMIIVVINGKTAAAATHLLQYFKITYMLWPVRNYL